MAHMKKHPRAALAALAAATTGLAAGVALAQEGEAALEEIVITGTRIANPNAVSSSPVLAVSAENIRLQGIVDAGDLVHTLPQQVSTTVDLSNTSNPLSGPGGITTMNLRGLGPQRTLVLVDGRRLGVGDPNSGNPNPSPDINQIPSALIERVDIVTGGASAVYGSDAIAGVANFIMRRDFEGVQIDAQYGFNWHENDHRYMEGLVDAAGLPLPSNTTTDGDEMSVSVVVGGNFADGKGNATGYLSYIDSNPVRLSERDFAACQLSNFVDFSPENQQCAGSSSSNRFRSLTNGADLAVLGDQLVPWGTPGTSPPALFNSNPYMNLKHGRERYQGGVFAKYEWSERATLYTDFMFMKDQAETAVAPSGLFQASPVGVYCNNPLLNNQQATALGCDAGMIANGEQVSLLIGRRNIEGGPRFFEYDHTNYRAMVGVRGDLSDAWGYDVYGSYYDTDLFNSNNGYLSIQRSELALNGCQQSPDPTNLAAGCVPWNIWQEGGVTQAATDYLFAYGLATGTATQAIGAASMTGDLGVYGIQLPSAEEGVGVAIGAEHRRDTFGFTPDQTLGSGDLSGSGGASPTINADTDVTEMYVEFRVPLVQGMTGAEDLVFETGYRYSDYELSGGVDTYKFGLQWAPIQSIRLRGSFNHAIRAPSLIELYNSNSVTNTSQFSNDPCAGPNPTRTVVECERTGLDPALYGSSLLTCPASQCAVLTGGNPEVQPETADTITVGFTLNPTALPDLTMSVDWYEIEVEDIIGAFPLNTLFAGCADGTHPEYCDSIVRTNFGTLYGDTIAEGGYLVGTSANVAKATFTGVDAQGSYRFDVGSLGSLIATLNAVYIIDAKTLPAAGLQEFDCAGLYGVQCGPATPEWRHSLRLSWLFPGDFQASLQWRYVDSVTNEQNSSEAALQGDPVEFGGRLSSRSYLDLAGTWDITDQYGVRLGINNLLDKDPPLVDTGWSGPGTPNTWGPYDTLGRQVFFAVTGKF